jgi:hypothetical protein
LPPQVKLLSLLQTIVHWSALSEVPVEATSFAPPAREGKKKEQVSRRWRFGKRERGRTAFAAILDTCIVKPGVLRVVEASLDVPVRRRNAVEEGAGGDGVLDAALVCGRERSEREVR